MKKLSILSILLIALYIISRIYIWRSGPVSFTEIIFSYMPYAHLWASGQRPYLDQWYEYPPATIPLFYIPHVIDRGTLKYPAIHLDYLQSYRGILLLVDIGVFVMIWKVLRKQKAKVSIFAGGLVYYIL